MRWLHLFLGHKQWIAESKLYDRRDYRFCSCGAVFSPL